MPTYQYICKNCGHELEELQSISAPPLTHCPACNTESLVRVLGSGSGLIFKGTGFYLTDYKKQSHSPGSGSTKKESKEKKEEKPTEKKKEKPDSPSKE